MTARRSEARKCPYVDVGAFLAWITQENRCEYKQPIDTQHLSNSSSWSEFNCSVVSDTMPPG